LDIPVFATADSAVYDIPQVNNDIEATAWAIWDATRTAPHGVSNIIKNTTTSGTFKIHAQLCVPKHSKKNVLQIATHGVHYDSRYWDSKYKPDQHSYVEAALKAGYSILTYDRLGVGQSDKPDAYTVVQAPLELEILRQLTLMAHNGTLYDFAAHAKPADSAFKSGKPSKVVHVGHSFGSFLTSAFISKYGPLSDGAVITGYLLTENLASAGSTSFSVEYAATGSPRFDRSSGYVVCKPNGIQNIFFGGNPKTAFTKELLNYGVEIKQPVPIGEFASAFSLIGLPGPSFKAPVQFLLPEFDFYICRGDCNGLADLDVLKQFYPGATKIEVALQPNTGHALPLHNNATAGFQLAFDFLGRNGL
jgi:pimeloyl-ACP methyl ester carboxylesterase